MMDEYPDPDEEYELLYQEEMEAMREMEEEVLRDQFNSKFKRSKNSLSFDSSSLNKENVCNKSLQSSDFVRNETLTERNMKRCLSTELLAGITPNLDIERPTKKHKSDVHTDIQSHECGITSIKIPKWPFVSVSTYLGEKLYVKINHENLTCNVSKNVTNSGNSSGLLVTPFSKLKIMAEETLKKAKDQVLDVEENVVEGSDLWIDKYKPRTYFDLLSDEAVNRTLLNWLKLWDKVVFKKEIKPKPVHSNNNYNNSNSNSNSNNNNNYNNKVNLINVWDDDGRPYYKIALLCGSPGLGKTTLAHIAADIAGYNIIEVNASDERTIEAINIKLEAATQVQSVMGNRKPSCLILDEIDGAPAPTIEYLLKYINGKVHEKSKKGKKEKPSVIIKRPIICICNELYSPSLRQLRQQAFVVHFPHMSSTKLAQRLLEICRKQDIKTDLSALTMLCDKAQNDIRSCISTIYFFKHKNGQRFKSIDVIQSSVGQKDIQKGMFNLWKEIFQIPIRRENFFSSVIDKGKEEEVSCHINYSKKAMDKLQHIVRIFQSAGDYDKLLQGVFENFPKSKFSGSAESLAVALQWFCWFDLLDTNVKKEQNFTLMSYLPYGFAAWHCLFSSNSFWKISYPSAGFENHTKEMRSKQILNDVLRGLNASMRLYNPKNVVLLDVLPMFNIILVPPIRSVNPALFNENEKKDFKQLVDIMIEYGLNFIQQRAVDGTYSFQYDPNIDELSRFNISIPNTRSFSYGMKQIIAHEVELERLRRAEESQSSVLTHTIDNNDKFRSDVKIEKADVVKDLVAKPQKKNVENEMQYKDFFGRIIKVINAVPADKEAADKNNPVKSPIWFNFKEGYNNAVKKDITMADLL